MNDLNTSTTHASTHAFSGCVDGESGVKSSVSTPKAGPRDGTAMATTTETGFGDLLRRYRIAAGVTQEELAERAGVSTRGISDLERGARGLPRKDTLHLLLQALDLSPADSAELVAA